MSQHPIKILIAEDEELVLEIMAKRISSQDYEVVKARDGQEAWERIVNELPDVIILDLNMPKMDGWAVLSLLRHNPPTKRWQPVIIVSAQNEVGSFKKGVDLEADHYLSKPCQIEDIFKAIRLMLSLIPPALSLKAMPQTLFYTVTMLAMLVAGLFALTRYLESIGVFFPNREMAVDPSVMGLPWGDIYFKTRDNVAINGWFFKKPHARSTMIFAHGNAGNISDRLFKIKSFYDLGLNVFIFDYRGYGKSQGKPSEAGVYLDAQGAYDYLQSRGDVDMDNIVLYGASLGGAVAIDLATHRKAALLVVESSITSAHDMAKILYPFIPSVFLSLKFDSIDKVRRLGLPKLFIHSPEDQVVPYWVGEKLFEAAAEPKEFLKIHGGHNDGSITTNASAAGEFIRILKAKDLI